MTPKWKIMLLSLIVVLVAALPIVRSLPSYHNRLPDVISRSLMTTQMNICDYCHCEKATVLCDFHKPKKPLSNIWNNAYFVPPNLTAIQVKLTRDTKFELHDGFFHTKNRVNRIIFSGGSQVEVTAFAFRNNQGGYPDIQILDTSNVFLKEHSFSGREFKLIVKDCETVVLFAEAFANVNASCNFVGIEHLEINKKAFSTNSTVNLNIEKANMNEIQSFEVVMNNINITRSTIGTILTKAFDVTNINELSFDHCTIQKIETGALTNRLFSNHVSITNSQIDTIESEAISGSGITELTLKNNTIQNIDPEAVKVHSTLVFIQDNEVSHSGQDWLTITDGQLIVVDNNHFMNSGQISLGHSRNSLNCSFANNRIESDKSIILNITNCMVRATTTNRPCSCDSSHVVTSFDHDYSSEIYCNLDAGVHTCFNATTVNTRRYINEACKSMLPKSTLHCTDGSVRIWVKGVGFKTKEETAKMNSNWKLTTIVMCIVMAVAIVMVIIIALCCMMKKCRAKTSPELIDKTAKCFWTDSELTCLKNETCTSTDGVFRKNVEKIIKNNGKQSVNECKDRITHLISQANNIPLGINRCLEEHLKKHIENNLLMSPPGLIYNPGNSPTPSAPILQNEQGDEPIYEEPQHPLLPTIYSEPHEGSGVTPVYSEPFNAVDANDMPPPYQAEYASPMRHNQLPQSTVQQQIQSTNTLNSNLNNNNNARYATPVWRPAASGVTTETSMAVASPPITHAQRHVRDLRQDLEAKPQFHPNQLTSIRNQRQMHITSPATSAPPTATIRHPQQRSHNQNHKQNPSQLSSRNSFECLDGAASLAAMEHMDMRGAAGSCDTGSDHSGGSDETVKIDDVIEYADA